MARRRCSPLPASGYGRRVDRPTSRIRPRPVRVPLFLQVLKADLRRKAISYERAAAAAGVSWTSQAQMRDEVYTIRGYFIAQKAALGHGKFRQWVEGPHGPLSYRTV